MASIIDVEGIGATYAAKLKTVGIVTTDALIQNAATRAAREQLAAATGISQRLILTWVNRVDLARVKGVAGQFAELLEAAGVDSVPELAQRNAEHLAAKLAEVAGSTRLIGSVPGRAQVADWIKQASKLPRVVTH